MTSKIVISDTYVIGVKFKFCILFFLLNVVYIPSDLIIVIN